MLLESEAAKAGVVTYRGNNYVTQRVDADCRQVQVTLRDSKMAYPPAAAKARVCARSSKEQGEHAKPLPWLVSRDKRTPGQFIIRPSGSITS